MQWAQAKPRKEQILEKKKKTPKLFHNKKSS